MSEIKEKLLWAIETIRNKEMFGRDELGASLAREKRAKGVMLDAIKDFDKLNNENEKLKYIIKQTIWMARRYADKRSTFAPSDFNEAVHFLDDMGLQNLLPSYDGQRFADDGTLGKYDPETKQFELEKQ